MFSLRSRVHTPDRLCRHLLSQGHWAITRGVIRANARPFKSMQTFRAEEAEIKAASTSQFRPSRLRRVVSKPEKPMHFRTNYNPLVESWEISTLDNGGNSKSLRIIPQRWLRDHCQCNQCVHPETKQRLFDVFKVEDFRIKHCEIGKDQATVTWHEGNHESQYDLAWLAGIADPYSRILARQGHKNETRWGPEGAAIHKQPPEVKYDDVMTTSKGLADWTRKIREVGFCFVDGCPADPQATQALLERIGPIRNTHYGAFWDFTSDLASKDTAYTSLGLDVHTDTTYFTEPAGLQLFHLLSHDGSGGETQLVDGFSAADKLRSRHPWAYETLRTVKIMAHASGNEGLSIQPNAPFTVIEFDKIARKTVKIRWNNSDRSMITVLPPKIDRGIDTWYSAAKEFNKILQEESELTRYEFPLRPGRPMIFDNWRVLHGRSAFTGRRRMCGGYINRDDFISRYRTSNFGYESVLKDGIY